MKIQGMRIGVKQVRMVLGVPGQATSAFNRCVGGKLHVKGGTRTERNARFTSAASSCKGTKGK